MQPHSTVEQIEDNRQIVSHLKQHATLESLYRSDFYHKHGAAVEELLNRPRIYMAPSPEPQLASFLRVVAWNIERGAQFDRIAAALTTHPVMRFADVILLNEVDIGMARSGNRNVARDLAQALGMHAIYGAEFLEMTKGVGKELELDGENIGALHGNCILTRRRFSNPRIIPLPACCNQFEFAEKRYGRRVAVSIDVDLGGATLMAVTAHLEVYNSPACRARQMKAVLDEIDARKINNPVLIGGDFNTNTFPRGTRLRTIRNLARLLLTPRERLDGQLKWPHSREPLFRLLNRRGYIVDDFNTDETTCSVQINLLGDSAYLPRPARNWAQKRLGGNQFILHFRLDWFAARGLRALSDGKVVDELTGQSSIGPRTISGLGLSDHDPIVVDITPD